MPRLPNGDRAIIDRRKLTDYILDPAHPLGRHKARRFRETLGIASLDADLMLSKLVEVAAFGEAFPDWADEHGQRYRIDFVWAVDGRRANVRTAWIIEPGEDFPRFVTAFVDD